MIQTAVEFAVEKLAKLIPSGNQLVIHIILQEAKEIEKEQIEDAFCGGVDDEYEHHINGNIRKNSEQYYKETYENE